MDSEKAIQHFCLNRIVKMLPEISFLGYSLTEIKLEEWKFPLTTFHVIFKQSFLQKPKLFFLLQKL